MKARNSNIELLRIIAMTFIVIWHISIHAQKGETVTHDFVASITITGVNLFLLITGYFGLKLSWKSLLNIVAIVTFYSIVSLLLNKFIFDDNPTFGEIIISTLTPIAGHTNYWFVSCYIILMILSPCINVVINKASENEYRYTVGALIFISCITGYLIKGNININGYTVMQFITMYFLGNAIKRYNIAGLIKKSHIAITYIAMTTILYIGGLFNIGRTYHYNNPAIIIASIALFCIIINTKFKSNTINNIATYMFPVYLLQDGIFGCQIYKLMYKFGVEEDFCSTKYLLVIGLYIAVLFASSVLLEHIRRYVMQRPIATLAAYLDKKAGIFKNI